MKGGLHLFNFVLRKYYFKRSYVFSSESYRNHLCKYHKYNMYNTCVCININSVLVFYSISLDFMFLVSYMVQIQIVQLCLEYICYDPNYYYGTDDDEFCFVWLRLFSSV